MKKLLNVTVLMCVFTGATLSLPAQTAEPPPTQAYQPLADQDLDTLLKPIALYPDPLIAQILAAATLPTQIVLADRYVQGSGDPNEIGSQPWDPSVQALAHYPTVLKWLDDNLDWTTELGEAFLNQQPEVMNSVQRLRATAQNLGNLQSTPQQQVTDDGADIEIVPADPDEIYVPIYNPDDVYDESGGPFITFGVGFAIGWWLNCDFDWGHHHMIVWDHDHPRPHDWWHERGDQRAAAFAGHSTVWNPVHRAGYGVVRGGDRGWNNGGVNRSVSRPGEIGGHGVPAHDDRPNNVHVGPAIGSSRSETFTRAPEPSTGAFIGSRSPEEARDFSNRGQESMGTAEHSAPASGGGGSFHSSGGGGGSHGGGSSGGGGGGHR
jgi:uncharacterized membrane protein YgcG